MNRIILTSILFLATQFMFAQSEKILPAGQSYTETFDDIGNGLPIGWFVVNDATDSTTGTGLSFNPAPIGWSNTAGGFKNFAGVDGLSASSSVTQQNNSTNRALGIRQTNSFGEPGGAFCWQIANTINKENIELTLDHLIVSPQNRSSEWFVQYSVNQGANWTTLGTYITPAGAGTSDWGDSTISYALDSNANNLNAPLLIRIVSLTNSSGSGSRDSYAIDNAQLNWTLNCSSPALPDSIYATDVTFDRVTIQWPSSTCADEFLIVATDSTSILATPSGNGSAYSGGAFGTGTAITSNEFVVYKGTAAQAEITGLFAGTDYQFGLFVRRGSDWSGPITIVQTTPTAGRMYYTGLGNPGEWGDPANWNLNRLPDVFDTVVIDNQYVNGSFTITLPQQQVIVRALYLTPNDSVTLILPQSNSHAPGLEVLATDTGLVIGNKATFINESGASSGSGWLAQSWKIKSGGTYIHNVNRATASLLNTLDNSHSEFAEGRWVFGSGFSTVPSFTNRTFPTLVINGTPQPLTFISGAPLTIEGDLIISENTNYNFTLPVHLKKDVLIEGEATFSYAAGHALTINGNTTQELTVADSASCIVPIGRRMQVDNDLIVKGPLWCDSICSSPLATLNIDNHGQLTFWTGILEGPLINNGYMTLPANDSSYGQLWHDSASGNGIFEQQMYISGSQGRWFQMGSPSMAPISSLHDGSSRFNVNTNNTSPVFFWDAINCRYELPSSLNHSMSPGKGFMVYVGTNQHGTFTTNLPGNIQTKGVLSSANNLHTPLHHGQFDHSQNTTVQGEEDGWNLVANPYPMSYDWHGHDLPIHTEGTIYLPNGSNNGFIAVGITETDSTRYLSPLQGFWIRTTNQLSQSTDLVFSKHHRSFNRQNTLRRTQQSHPRFKFAFSDSSGQADIFTVGFHHLATDSFDNAYDGYKRINSPELPSVWGVNGSYAHALMYLPPLNPSREIPLTFSIPQPGALYTFALSNDYGNLSEELWLEDRQHKIFRNLRTESHSFSVHSDTVEGRYYLHIGKRPSSIDRFGKKTIDVWQYQRIIYAQFDEQKPLQLHDMYGRLVKTWTHQGSGTESFSVHDLPAGNYIVVVDGHRRKITIID